MLYFLKFHSLIVFTSWDIAQYMHCNYLFHNLWRHKFWNLPDPLNQAVFLHDQKVKTKILIFWEGKELSRWNKNQFSSFLKGFQWSKIVSDFWVRFSLLINEIISTFVKRSGFEIQGIVLYFNFDYS